MKKMMKKFLFELLKDSKRSDRELAKVLGTSQATVSRMRNKLVRDGLIRQFTIIPDFAKIGFEIMAISSFKSRRNKEIKRKSNRIDNVKPKYHICSQDRRHGKECSNDFYPQKLHRLL